MTGIGGKGDLLDEYEAIARAEDDARRKSLDEDEPETTVSIGHAIAATFRTMHREAWGLIRDPEAADQFGAASARYVAELQKREMSDSDIRERLIPAVHDLNAALNVCESPIEKMILPWLIFADFTFGRHGRKRPPNAVVLAAGDVRPSDGASQIVPQLAIYGRRLDFALQTIIDGLLTTVAVECDGIDFHDLAADRERDVFLAERGIKTVRAAGREIFRNPALVAMRAADAVRSNLWAAGV